jgi:hypothetical protein
VPSGAGKIRGRKYQPDNAQGADYNAGDPNTGWTCLRFGIQDAHYHRYRYQTGGAPTQLGLARRGRPNRVTAGQAWSASAQGDLDGDAVYSWFALIGYITSEREVIVAPGIYRQDEGE